MTHGPASGTPRTLFFRLSVRLALVGLVFLVVELAAVVWMYVRNSNELDHCW